MGYYPMRILAAAAFLKIRITTKFGQLSQQGDSGGPLSQFDSDAGRMILVGVNSGAVGDCGRKTKPGKKFGQKWPFR